MTTQPIVFDLINKVSFQVGVDPEADRRYAEILREQGSTTTSAEGFPKPQR